MNRKYMEHVSNMAVNNCVRNGIQEVKKNGPRKD